MAGLTISLAVEAKKHFPTLAACFQKQANSLSFTLLVYLAGSLISNVVLRCNAYVMLWNVCLAHGM